MNDSSVHISSNKKKKFHHLKQLSFMADIIKTKILA